MSLHRQDFEVTIENRKQIRRLIIQQRNQLTPGQQQQLSGVISQHFLKTLLFLKSKRTAFYFAHHGEVDPSSIVTKALAMHKECFFPVLDPVKHNRLWFASYHAHDKLIKNCYGIWEPNLQKNHSINPRILDTVIMPLVAFDTHGNRLGMGGGYYDRTFAFLKEHAVSRPKLIGLAYEFQKVASIEIEPWDIPLDYIITEKVIYRF